jgi:hypothetical protein
MTTLADLVIGDTPRTPSARCYLDGKRWYGVQKLSFHQKFKEQIESGGAEGRDPPIYPRIGMTITATWGYNGLEVAGLTGVVSDLTDFSYPDRCSLVWSGVLWMADQNDEVLQTSPLNDILASAAVRYLLTHYGGISASRLSIPVLPASGAAWVGGEWTLGTLTPVQWGDVDTESGGTTALKAAAEICSGLGFWLRADASGKVTATQMEKKPSPVPREVFREDINLLMQGAPERRQSYADIRNRVTVRGADTGVDGAQLWDQRRTNHPLLPPDVNKDFTFSSTLLEYENASDAGEASVSSVAARILNVVSRIPDVVPLRAKADPNRKVGDTVGIIDTGIAIPTQRNFFIYELTRSLDLTTGAFDDQLLLDGGTGSSGYTTVPPPDASFSWTLMAETLDGMAVVEVALDGSGSTSPTGEIVSWAWSTVTPTYAGSPASASGVTSTLLFEAADSPAVITLTVVDTTSKIGTFEASIDLTGADLAPPLVEVLSVAGGSAWLVTPDGGATWNVETANGDATSVGTIGAGYDDRAAGTALTYGLLATRGALGAGGLRQTVDALATASTNAVANAAAITSNIWVNEANPARVWFAIGSAVYRSTDGGLTKTAMAVAPGIVSWIMEDAAVDDSVFLLAGADLYHATAPTVGWALLYAGPLGATARQFVRSRDGQVTWICYTGAPAGEALQRVENGAAADFAATDVRSLELDRNASSLAATVYGVTGDDPAELWAFDGITGLSAVQSSQTFPSGATVQHLLGSRQFDVIYCADFDSIGANQGAVRKYFPTADLLLLYKELATGQQAHMLGLGGPALSVAVELWRVTFGAASGGPWRYTRADGWVLRATGLPTGKYWYRIVANPSNADELIIAGGSDAIGTVSSAGLMADATPAFWRTVDAGLTWASMSVTAGGSLGDQPFVEFSSHTPGQWIIGGNARYAVRGSGNASTAALDFGGGTDNEARYVVDGDAGDLLLSKGDGIWYFDIANSQTTRNASGKPFSYRAPTERQIARTALVAVDQGLFGSHRGEVWYTPDYRSVDYDLITTVINAGWVTSTLDGTVYLGGFNTAAGLQQVRQIVDIAGAATESDVGPFVDDGGNARIGSIRADRQTRTSVAATIIRYSNTSDLVVLTAAGWSRLVGPPIADGPYADAVEVIVRS